MSGSGPIDTVVLDFDGTLTDADAHEGPFHEASLGQLAAALGCERETLRAEWRTALDELRRSAPEAVWSVGGQGVCPAHGDPYVLANSAALRLLTAHGVGPSEDERRMLVGQIHSRAYRAVPPPFRADARSSLAELLHRGLRVAIVTNSHTDAVCARLDTLALEQRGELQVRGGARKFEVTAPPRPSPRFDSLPAELRVPGLGRPVLLGRGHYFALLAGLWRDGGPSPATTLVVGDMFELDLALPSVLGAAIHLVLRAGTLAHEREASLAQPRGTVGEGVRSLLARL